jgi:hypothetical protein
VQTAVDRGGDEAWSCGVDTGWAESHCLRVWVNRDLGIWGSAKRSGDLPIWGSATLRPAKRSGDLGVCRLRPAKRRRDRLEIRF